MNALPLRLAACASLALGLGLAPAAAAQEPPDLVDLLSHRAPIEPGASTYQALPLTAEVLAIAAPDLSDVRIVGAGGAPVPYAVATDEVAPIDEHLESFELPATSASHREERGAGGRVSIEEYEVTVPEEAWREHAELALLTPREDFTATVRVRAGGVEVGAGTIFSLPSVGARRDSIDLPARFWGAVQIEIRSEPSTFGGRPPAGAAAFLTPRLVLRQRSAESHRLTVEQALQPLAERTEAGAQIVEFARPAGLSPIALRVETSSPTLVAGIRVEAIRGDGTRREVGRGRLVRVTPGDPALAFSDLTVPLLSDLVGGDRLVISIDRGDSPPLEGLTVLAVARQPTLLFDGSAAGATPALHFGGGRLAAPRYDVAQMVEWMARSAVPARLGPVEPSPGYRREPALAFAMRAGAAVDRSRFSVEAPLVLGEAPEGLTRVVLSPALVADARDDLGDVRIVDADGRQWPYLPAGSEREAWVDLEVRPGEGAPQGTSVYVLRPTVGAVRADLVEITVSDQFYSRSVEIVARARPEVADEPPTMVGQAWIQSDPNGDAPRVPLRTLRARLLELHVRDGDEAPLVVTSARARVQLRDLFVTAPAGDYLALAGDSELGPPDYDVARRGASLLSDVPAAEATIGEARPSAAFRAPGLLERTGWQSIALYAALGLAVLGLGLFTIRLAREEPAPTGGQPQPAGAAAEPGAQTAPASSGTETGEAGAKTGEAGTEAGPGEGGPTSGPA